MSQSKCTEPTRLRLSGVGRERRNCYLETMEPTSEVVRRKRKRKRERACHLETTGTEPTAEVLLGQREREREGGKERKRRERGYCRRGLTLFLHCI